MDAAIAGADGPCCQLEFFAEAVGYPAPGLRCSEGFKRALVQGMGTGVFRVFPGCLGFRGCKNMRRGSVARRDERGL